MFYGLFDVHRYLDVGSGGRRIQIIYLSKMTNTTMWEYFHISFALSKKNVCIIDLKYQK